MQPAPNSRSRAELQHAAGATAIQYPLFGLWKPHGYKHCLVKLIKQSQNKRHGLKEARNAGEMKSERLLVNIVSGEAAITTLTLPWETGWPSRLTRFRVAGGFGPCYSCWPKTVGADDSTCSPAAKRAQGAVRRQFHIEARSSPHPSASCSSAAACRRGGFVGTERTWTRSDGRTVPNSVDECGEHRTYGDNIWGMPLGGTVVNTHVGSIRMHINTLHILSWH